MSVDVDPEPIPDELKELDKWLVWDTSKERKRPFTWDTAPTNLFGAKKHNEDDHLTFEEALEAAEASESVGIGLAFDEDDPYVGFDFDGCYTEDGDAADWFPSIREFEGYAYIERSPSGEGLHAWARDTEIPEWWSNIEVEGDVHRGVEVYDKWFFTVTGDSLGSLGHGDGEIGSVGDIGPFLRECHKSLKGEDPLEEKANAREEAGETASASTDADEWLTEEHVRDALGTVSADVGYNTWRDVGFALADFFDSKSTAQRVFKDWSRTGSKWDDEAEARAERIIDDAEDGGGRTVATVVHLAKQNGWDLPTEAYSSENSPQPTAEDADGWDEVRRLYKQAESPASPMKKGTCRHAAAQVLEDETDWMYVLESERLWVYDEASGTFDGYGEAYVGRRLAHELGDHFSQTEKREIVGHLEDRNHVHRDELNARHRDDPLVCVGNGVVNLRTGERHDHDPEYQFIRGLEWDYDPARADPSRVLEFLDDVTERTEDRDTLLDHLAHGLMPGHPYRAFVVCYGPGGNGKTQVAELFRGFVGSDNAAAVEIDELASDDFATSDLPGKFINWGDDMAGDGGGMLKDLSLLKKASGGSEIRANEKHEKTFNFKNEAAMFFSANEPPNIGEQKSSIEDRIYPIEMPYRFTANPDPEDAYEKDKTPNISQDLLDDEEAMRGLLLLAVKHAQDLEESNGEYSQPETGEERLEKYNRSADPIRRFTAKALEPASGEYKIRKDDAYRLYVSYADSWDERPASEDGFKRQFSRSFPAEIEDGRSRALVDPDDDSDRVYIWKRVRWTPLAREKMPDWMEERYSDHFDGEDMSDDVVEEESESAELAGLAPGRHDLVVTVAEKMDPKPWQQGRGHLVDDEGNIMEYVAEGSSNPLAGATEGDTVEIANAKVGSDRDGLLRVEVSGVCEVSVEPEVGRQGGLDETSKSASADGGTVTDSAVPEDAEGATADARRLAELIGSRMLSKQKIQSECVDEFGWGIDEKDWDGLIRKALKEGLLEEPKEGEYRQV